MGSSFTEEEKRFVLSEMIKQSTLDLDVLVEFVRSNTLYPDWHAMQVPGGRTLNQCFDAAESMLQTTVTRPSLKRKAYGSPPEQTPKRIAAAEPTQPPGQPLLPLAPIHLHQPASLPMTITPLSRLDTQHVNIQPKPPTLGHAGAATPTGPPTPSSTRLPPGNRRRGRPSRADQSRQYRPAIPQLYSPLAPRTPILEQAEEAPRLGSPSVASPVAPVPGSQDTPKPAKKRGRPPLAEKAKSKIDGSRPLQSLASTPPIAQHDAQPGPATVPAHQPDTPETSSSSMSHSPGKERAIPSISHITQEGMAS